MSGFLYWGVSKYQDPLHIWDQNILKLRHGSPFLKYWMIKRMGGGSKWHGHEILNPLSIFNHKKFVFCQEGFHTDNVIYLPIRLLSSTMKNEKWRRKSKYKAPKYTFEFLPKMCFIVNPLVLLTVGKGFTNYIREMVLLFF